MQKLTLALDTLRVSSFSTTDAEAGVRGTVRGAESYDTYWCTAPSSVGPNVCAPSDALGCTVQPKLTNNQV